MLSYPIFYPNINFPFYIPFNFKIKGNIKSRGVIEFHRI